MSEEGQRFNPPPGWPRPPSGWKPPLGWAPDPAWPDPPPGWQLWLSEEGDCAATGAEPAISDAGAAGVGVEASSQSRDAELESPAVAEPLDGDCRTAGEVGAEEREGAEGEVGSVEPLDLNDERILQEVGIYRYHHPLENAAAYKQRLQDLSSRIAELVKAKGAIEMSSRFTFDNSLAKGRKMCSDLGKLMLRAYNAEVDNSLRTLRVGNVVTAKRRVEASRAAIKKLGRMMEMQISDAFHAMRLEEIELTADYLMMKQEEREAAREERARLREERKVAAELAAEREQLDKERAHLLNALESLRTQGGTDEELEQKLADLDEAISQNDYRAANIRAGYVYVISNRGAFGRDVVKIGLTRRLEPLDRVHELGGASVPFRFDVHGLFFSEDAVSLETELHHHFSERRVNQANARKEFFFASASEVRDVLESKMGNLLEFTDEAECAEFHQSRKYWPEERRSR